MIKGCLTVIAVLAIIYVGLNVAPKFSTELVEDIIGSKETSSPPAASTPGPSGTSSRASSSSLPSSKPTVSNGVISIKGISIGNSVETVIQKLGQPARKDPGEYDMEWYIYNKDYTDYVQIGIANKVVVALYSPSSNWSTSSGIADGAKRAEVLKQYGDPLSYILKGNTQYMLNYGQDEYGTYKLDGMYVTFFYDIHLNHLITGVQVIEEQTELSLTSFYTEGSPGLAQAFELQNFDLTNATRAKMQLEPFKWSSSAAGSSRKHSEDMANRNFFDHMNLDGQDPFERMEKEGISYRAAAENIAAGQTSAIYAHHGWLNSKGHRVNLLSDIKQLGVGVHFGGKMNIYYTQNFYTP
jgi:uncharacterized protein YkwD